MYGDLLLAQLGVNFLGPAPLDLELLHMLTTFHWNAVGSILGWWFCHNNTVSYNENFWVEQVTVPHPPLGKDEGGRGTQKPTVPKGVAGWTSCSFCAAQRNTTHGTSAPGNSARKTTNYF